MMNFNILWNFSFIYRTVTIVYLHHSGEKNILDRRKSQQLTFDQDDPLQAIKALGLNLGNTTNYI